MNNYQEQEKSKLTKLPKQAKKSTENENEMKGMTQRKMVIIKCPACCQNE